MNSRLKALGLALVLSACFPVSTTIAAPLPTDSRVVTGTLENGLTWMYRQHDNPPGKMAMMMHVRTGSLNEKESQRGLAHFIEHMCFNGTENFAPGELIPYFESIGMEFGADLNAFTSFDQTAYMLFTPDTEVAQIDKALMVLSDYAFRVLMLEEEIDKERGVVLEESRRGKNTFQRIRDKVWPELFEGSLFAERLPIGLDDIIENATKADFVDYYRAWYRPENITLIMIGDADHEQFLPSIEKWFGEYSSPAPARPQQTAGFKPFTKERSIIATDPEMGSCDISVLNIKPGRPATTTVEQSRVELVEYIGNWIVRRRYDQRVTAGEASFRHARTGVANFFHDGLLISAGASGEPQDWAKMLEELIVEISRAREYGFTQRESDLAKKEILADAERSVKTESTRNAKRMIRGYLGTVNNEEPILSAEQELTLYQDLLPSIELAELNKTFADHFKPGSFAYVVEMVDKDDVAVPTRDDVLAAARAAWARKVAPVEEEDAPTELLAQMPKPGKVVEQTIDDDLGVTTAILANGVRVHHRYMDYKKDSILISIKLAGGQIQEDAGNAGITEVATLLIKEPATSRLSTTNIRDIMTGKNISVRGSAEEDTFTISVTGSPEDLEIGLQQAHAILADGKLEQAAFDNWKLQTLQQLETLEHMPMFKTMEAVTDLLSGGDPRRMIMITKEQVETQSVQATQAWFDRLRNTAPIEVAAVGDMKLDVLLPLIEKYLGSLPERERSAAKLLDPLRRLARPTGPLVRHIKVDTMAPKAMSIAGFVAADASNTYDRRAIQVASNVLSSRLVKRIREELSLVYSIRASARPTWAYKDSSVLVAAAPCDPKNAQKVVDEVHAQFKDFAENGPSEEEVENAKKQILENLDTQMREPSYWWHALGDLDLHGRNLDDLKTIKADYKAFTAEQVRKTFAKYYIPTRLFSVTGVPIKAESSSEDADKKPKRITTPAS